MSFGANVCGMSCPRCFAPLGKGISGEYKRVRCDCTQCTHESDDQLRFCEWMCCTGCKYDQCPNCTAVQTALGPTGPLDTGVFVETREPLPFCSFGLKINAGARFVVFIEGQDTTAFVEMKSYERSEIMKSVSDADIQKILASPAWQKRESFSQASHVSKTSSLYGSSKGVPSQRCQAAELCMSCLKSGATLACSDGCKLFYCNETCKNKSWPQHQTVCRGRKQDNSNSRVTCCVSVSHPRAPLTELCMNCFKSGATFACSDGCRLWYCNEACKTTAWPRHGKDCRGRKNGSSAEK